MIFYEKLGIFPYIFLSIRGEKAYYGRLTFCASLTSKTAARITFLRQRSEGIKQIEWGDTEYMTNVIRNASFNAGKITKTILERYDFFNSCKNQFGINFKLVLEKFLFSQKLYEKYFLYELVLRYIDENSDSNNSLFLDLRYIGPYKDKITKENQIIPLLDIPIVGYIKFIFLMPLLFIFYWTRTSRNSMIYNDQIICEAHSAEEFNAYKKMLCNIQNIRYISLRVYEEYFSSLGFEQRSIDYPTLGSKQFIKLVAESIDLSFKILIKRGYRIFNAYELLLLLKTIFSARGETPIGSGNTLLTFEHNTFSKTLRNEFLRGNGSKSVFFSYLPGFALSYYPQEFYENYDFVFSSGKYLEKLFSENKAITKKFFPTGTYRIQNIDHGGIQEDLRIERLRAKKTMPTVITVLSTGVCKPTYISEVKLMKLAQQLSLLNNVEVFVRKKPFIPEKQYASFYDDFARNYESLQIIGDGFELFDFLPVTDLFVTSYSTSICEIACRGGNIFFVDLLKQPDRFIFWQETYSNGLLLQEHSALKEISDWVLSDVDGKIRLKHKQALEKLVSFLEYQFSDFKEYKENLNAQLHNSGILT